MPLNNAYLPKVDGLQTETSPISADPRSLSDCVDIISDVEDSIEARHGHPSIKFNTLPYGALTSNQTPTGLYAYRNEDEKIFVCLYRGSDNISRYRLISTSTEEVQPDSTIYSPSVIDNKSITRLTPVNTNPTSFAHDERLLFLTDYGVFYTSYSNYSQIPEKVDFPVIRTANVKSIWLPADTSFTNAEQENRHWLVPGFQVNVKIVIEIDAKQTEKGERVLLSPPSKIYEAKNFNLSNIDNSKRTSNTLVKITDVSLSHTPANSDYTVKFYRTPQFPIGEPPITEYYYAGEINDISNEIYLTANDDVVTTLEHLYNDTSQGGFSVTNHQPIPAKNVTEFLNYYIYSCITPPTISQFGLKQLPKDGETLTLRLTGATGVIPKEKTITFKNSPNLNNPSEVKIAANATSLTSNYLSNEDDLTFTGLRSTQGLDTAVRIVPGTGQGEVPAYGRITGYSFPGSAVFRVVPDTEGFDINKFPQPGVAVIVSSDGKVRLLFPYSSYRRVSASSGFIDFEGSVSVGRPTPQGTGYSGSFYMYALNVENLETTLPTSAGVNTTTSNLSLYYGDGSNYLSLLPCKNSLPFPVASPSPVTTTEGATALFEPDFDFLVNPFYVGLLNKPQGKLLDDMAIAIADAFQNLMNDSNSAIISCTGGESRENGVVNVEILDPTYEIIEFRRGTNSTDIYEPVIGTDDTEFARSEDDKGAFVISKQNNPELIPYGGTSDIAGPYVTTKVGNPDKAIVACASTKDSVYFLKEDGIARLSLVPGALVPLVDSIFIFDNTTFCVSAGSVQNLQDSIVFLAQDGVYTLSGTSIQKLSMAIEREIKKAISECRAVGKQGDIRSFANDAKGLYGLTIPLTGANFVTYILSINTMRWTKWSNTWKGAVVDQDGRLTTHIGDATDNGLRQDKYTNGNPYNPVDQIDDNISLNGFTPTDTDNVRNFAETGIGFACSRFGSKQVYYRQNDGTLTKVTIAIVGNNEVNITFPSTPPTFNNGDSLVVGVNVSLTFNPFTNGNPSDLKMFSGFHIHTVENVKDLKCSFRTEARNTFSTVTSFSVSPTDRTVYRCNIPLEAVRGRYLYRKVDHVRPFEIFTMPAQAIIFRNTGSTRVNKESS
jgi:hypothetical protein